MHGKKQLSFESFFIAEKTLTQISIRLDLPGELELQVVSGGPVFLFEGPIDSVEAAYLATGEKETHPRYLLAACPGQAAYRYLNEATIASEIFAYAKVGSIGHVRVTC